MDACTCGESRWSVGRMRSEGTGGDGTSVSGESWGVGDVCNWRLQKFTNVSARPLAHWCAFGEEEEMEPWMNTFSDRITCSAWFSARKHQKRHKVPQLKTGQIHWLGFASLFLSARRGILAPAAYGANMPEWVLYSIYFSVDFYAPKLTVSLWINVIFLTIWFPSKRAVNLARIRPILRR